MSAKSGGLTAFRCSKPMKVRQQGILLFEGVQKLVRGADQPTDSGAVARKAGRAGEHYAVMPLSPRQIEFV